MSIYHGLVVALLFFALLMRGWRRGNTGFIIIAVILMFVIQGLRDNKTIGNDSRVTYRNGFYIIGKTEWADLNDVQDWMHVAEEDEEFSGRDRNFAIRWLMKAVYVLSDGEYQWFIAIVAMIVLSSEAFLINRYSPSPLQSILYYLGLLFFVFQMSATKQSLAMCLLIFSFSAIIDRRPIRFILLVIIASFFHFPALVFLPAYWIANMKIGRGYFILLAGVFALTYVFRARLAVLLNNAYYESEIELSSTMRFLANKVIVMLVIIFAAVVIRPPHPEDRVYCALLQLMGVAAVIQTFAGYSNAFERLADYYFQFAVVFIPMVFERVKTRWRYLSRQTLSLVFDLGPFIFCSFAIWRFLDNITNDVHFTPFRFFFQ